MSLQPRPRASAVPFEATLVNAWLFGIASGLLAGLGLFVATNWLVLKGGEAPGQHLALLGQYFLGYRVTFVGSLIGLGYGFATGFGAGGFLAVIYNTLVRLRQPAQTQIPAETHS